MGVLELFTTQLNPLRLPRPQPSGRLATVGLLRPTVTSVNLGQVMALGPGALRGQAGLKLKISLPAIAPGGVHYEKIVTSI